MTPELNKSDGLPNAAEPDVTRRMSVGAAEPPDAAEPEEKRNVFSSLRDAYERARDGRRPAQPTRQDRTAKSVDRSKGLLILAVAVIVMIFVFLGMFSSSSGTTDRAANRTKPSLGRPENAMGGAAATSGSVTPLRRHERAGWKQRSTQRG